MGIFGTIKDKVFNGGKAFRDGIRKPPHEREGYEKVAAPLANLVWNASLVGYRMVMGSPLPTLFRGARQNISHRSFVQVEDNSPLIYNGKPCKIANRNILKSRVLEKGGEKHLQYNGQDYRLILVKDHHDKEVRKGNSSKKLYRVVGMGGDDENTVVYIAQDNKLDTDNPNQPIFSQYKGKLKVIDFVVRDRVTGEKSWMRTVLLFPFALTATLLKLPGAIVKALTDSLHGMLSKISTKLINAYSELQGLERQGEHDGHIKLKAKIILGKSIGVFANVMKGIGDVTNNLSGFLSSVAYSPSIIPYLGDNIHVVSSYLTHTTKDLLNGLKGSAREIINPFTISLDKPSGHFSKVIEQEKKDNVHNAESTVEYGAMDNILKNSSANNKITEIGRVLKEVGFQVTTGKSIPKSTERALYSALNDGLGGGLTVY